MGDDKDTRGPRERVYDEHIEPLIGQVIALCKEHKIPTLMSFELDEHPENGPLHCTTALIGGAYKTSDGRLSTACDIIYHGAATLLLTMASDDIGNPN